MSVVSLIVKRRTLQGLLDGAEGEEGHEEGGIDEADDAADDEDE